MFDVAGKFSADFAPPEPVKLSINGAREIMKETSTIAAKRIIPVVSNIQPGCLRNSSAMNCQVFK